MTNSETMTRDMAKGPRDHVFLGAIGPEYEFERQHDEWEDETCTETEYEFERWHDESMNGERFTYAAWDNREV